MNDLGHISNNAIALYIKGLEAKGYSKQEIAAKLQSIGLFTQWAYEKDHFEYKKYQHFKDEIAKYTLKYAPSADFPIATDQHKAISPTWASPIEVRGPPNKATTNASLAYGKGLKLSKSSILSTPLDHIYRLKGTLISFFDKIKLSGLASKRPPKMQNIPVLGPTEAWPRVIASSTPIIPSPTLSTMPNSRFLLASVMTLLVFSILSVGIYDRFFREAQSSFAYPTTPTSPSTRFLSFQGRLTDSLGNPVVAATNMRFRLYTASSGGSTLYDSGTCSISPDQDGIHNVLIGSSCGSGIASSVFTENSQVWLGVTVGSDSEMTPRQQIANVPYAMNAETLQGLPAGTTASTVPYINQDGDLLIAASTPSVASTFASQTFAVTSANAITIQSAGSGDVTLTATGSGTIKFATGGSQHGIVTNTGLFGFGTSGPDAKLDVLATSGEQLRLTYTDGSVYSGFTTNSSGDLTIATTGGDYAFTDSSNTLFQIKDQGVYPFVNLAGKTDTGDPASCAEGDIYYNDTDDTIKICHESNTWEALDAAAGASAWDDITAPTDNLSLSMAAYNTTFTWDPGANAAETAFTLNFDGEDSSTDDDQVLMALNQTSNGADVTEAADALLTFTNSDANDPVENAIRFDAGAAGTDFTYGINFDAASIGTAELVLQNGETIDNTVDGTIALTGSATISGNTTLGDASGDTLTANAAAWTFANDTTVALSGGLNGINFDSNTLSIDGASNRVGFGTAAPAATIDSLSTSEQMRLSYDVSNYTSFTVASTGDLTLDSTGGDINFADNDVFSVGGSGSDVAYNVIGDSTAGASANMNSDDDLYVEGNLEVDGTIYGNVSGTITPSFTPGSVVFTDGSGNLAQDNASFFFDDTNNRLGIGDTTPDTFVDITGTTTQLRLSYETGDTNYTNFTVSSGGDLTIAPTGNDTNVTGNLATSAGTTFGDASGDSVTSNAATWTFANDTAVALSGGVDGLNFDSNTLSIDATNNKIGLGTAAPDGKLHVTGAAVGKALTIFNETGDQDIIAASASGNTRFRIANDGTVYGGYFLDISNTAYGIDPAGTSNFGGYSMKITGGALLAYDSGAVGIGATSPTGKLQVVGDESRFGDAGSVDFATADGDVYIEDALEVDGTLYTASIDTTFTAGSVVFAGTSGVLTEDNTNFFWDDSSNELGIGDTSPDAFLDVTGATTQLRLSYETGDTNYTNFTVSSGGDLTIAPSGGDTNVTGDLDVSDQFAAGPNGAITANQIVNIASSAVPVDTDGTYGVNLSQTLTGSGSSSATHYGIYSDIIQNSTSTGNVVHYGIYSRANNQNASIGGNSSWRPFYGFTKNDASSGTLNGTNVYMSNTQNASTGTISAATSYDSGITNSTTGTIGTIYHYLANSPTNASGTITTAYGAYIADQSVGTNTTAYGVYIANQSGSSGNAIGLYIADADDYSIQLASTDGDAASGITFGTDTNLYRSAANTLNTDDNLRVAGGTVTLAASGDTIDWGSDGAADPSTSSVGWKTKFYGTTYGLGVAGSTLWAVSDDTFKLYDNDSTTYNLKTTIGTDTDTYFQIYDASLNEDIRFHTNGTSWFNGGGLVLGSTATSAQFQVVGDESRFGNGGTITNATGNGDVFVEDVLEVDGVIYADGGITATGTVSGTDFSCTDCLDFAEFEDTLDLDASLTLNQSTSTWTQNFTGDTTTGLTYNANSVTTGTAVAINSTATSFSSGTLLSLDWSPGSLNTNADDLFKINTTNNGNMSGYYINLLKNSSSVFNIDQSGNVITTGDIAVNGDDITSDGTLTIDAATDINLDADGADIVFKDAGTTVATFTNTSTDLTIVPAGGDVFITGNLLPTTDDTYILGSDGKRWADLYLGPETLHIGTSTSDEGTISYTTSTNVLGIGGTGDLAIDMTGNDVTINDRTTIGSTTAGVGKLTVTGAETGKALAIFNETGNQNIITASASGTTTYNLTRDGDVTQGNDAGALAVHGSQYSLVPNASFEVNSDGDTTLPDAWYAKVGTPIWVNSGSAHGDNYFELTDYLDQGMSACFPIGQETAGGTNRSYTISLWYGSSYAGVASIFRWGLYTYTSRSDCQTDTSPANPGFTAVNPGNLNAWSYGSGTITPADSEKWARVWMLNNDSSGAAAAIKVDGVLAIPTNITSGLDVAETYPSNAADKLVYGEIVAFGSEETQEDADVRNIVRTSQAYDKNAFGVIATQPGLVLDDPENSYNKAKVALKGRVPVLVTTENGPIRVGDPITASSIPGVGMKATRSGRIIGYAMTEWTSANPKEIDQVTVFVNPETYVDLSVLTDLQKATKDLVNSVGSNIKSGLVETQKLVANTLKATQATIDELIVSSFTAREATLTDAQIERLNAQALKAQTIEAESIETETLDTNSLGAKSATISGTLVADTVDSSNIREMKARLERLAETQQTSTLDADQLSADIEEVQKYITQLTLEETPDEIADPETYQILDQDVSLDPGSSESILGTELANANLEALTVTGQASMVTLTVADAFSAGDVFIQGESILSLGNELKLSALEKVNIMNGAVTITADGTITAKGEVIAEKGVRTNTLRPLETGDNLDVALDNDNSINIKDSDGYDVARIGADGSAEFKNLTLDNYNEATSSAVVIAAHDNYRQTGLYAPAIKTSAAASGNGILPAGENDIIIFNEKITAQSIVNLTATSSTDNRPLYVDKIETCSDGRNNVCQTYFRVAIDDEIGTDATFNWLIVN